MLSKAKLSMNENGEISTSLKRIEMMDERIVIVPFDQLIKLKIEDIRGIEEIAVPDVATTNRPELIGFRKFEQISTNFILGKNGSVGVCCTIFPPSDMNDYGLGSIYFFLLQRYFESENKVTISMSSLNPLKEIQRKYKEYLKSDRKDYEYSAIAETLDITYTINGKTFEQIVTDLYIIIMNADKYVRSEIFK
jgi:hypothetical protein